MSHKGNTKEVSCPFTKAVLVKQFQENVSINGHLTMVWAFLLVRDCGVFDCPQRGKCGPRLAEGSGAREETGFES